MQIIIISVNHQLTPIEIREKVAFNKTNLVSCLTELYSYNYVNSCVILSTCNRSEVFITTDFTLEKASKLLINWFANTHNIAVDTINKYINLFSYDKAIKHISMVASGIDSLIVGEPQILGQLKESYQIAQDSKTLDKLMKKLFQHAFFVAKNIRTNTKINNYPVSVAYCGVKLAKQIFTNLSKQTVLLIGVNEMTELSARHFIDKNINELIIANRTIAKAKKMADKYNATAINLTDLADYLYKADIIISATASSVPILGKGIIESALKQRKRMPMLILDIAVPRDIEPEVEQLEDVYLYTIDDLKQVVDKNISNRNQEKILAENIIDKHMQDFKLWLDLLPQETIISEYKDEANEIKQQLLNKALKKINNGDDSAVVIKTLADQLTNKLLHKTFSNIKNNEQNKLK